MFNKNRYIEGIKPVALVMTATITPPSNVINLTRQDPKVRLDDYCRALKFYLGVSSKFIDRIIFIENSNSNVQAIKQLAETVKHDKNVEIISFVNGNNYPPEYGKGYGEFKMINYGLSKSKILSDTDHIWKVTGRLQLLNIASLIKEAPQKYMIYCDLRKVPFFGSRIYGNEWIDLRFFSFTLDGYNKYFRDNVSILRDTQSRSSEHYLYKIIEEALPEKAVVPRFKLQPTIAGYSGFSNSDYQNWKYRLKNETRSVLRRIAPYLWL